MTTACDLQLDVSRLDEFRPGYADLFTQYCAAKFEWDTLFAADVISNALRVFAISAIKDGVEIGEMHFMVTSPIVDEVIDVIMLNTPLLMWLETNISHGRMIHEPAYSHGGMDPVLGQLRYEWTISLLEAAGYPVDRKVMWPARLPADYKTCACTNDLEDCKYFRRPVN